MTKQEYKALALANDCNKYKMELTTNGVVITDAIKFVQINKEKLTISKKANSEESKEIDYDEGLEEEQDERTGEHEEKTTNQIF